MVPWPNWPFQAKWRNVNAGSTFAHQTQNEKPKENKSLGAIVLMAEVIISVTQAEHFNTRNRSLSVWNMHSRRCNGFFRCLGAHDSWYGSRISCHQVMVLAAEMFVSVRNGPWCSQSAFWQPNCCLFVQNVRITSRNSCFGKEDYRFGCRNGCIGYEFQSSCFGRQGVLFSLSCIHTKMP